MPPAISSAARATYYLAALRLLRFAEARSPTRRRFGPDAEALWKDFAGGLKTTDRIDTLLRDADTQWPGAFGARSAFGLRAVAEDDAFGADWQSLSPMEGERVWADAMKGPPAASMSDALAELCRAWELTPQPFELPRLSATARILVAGTSAIASAIEAFAGNADLSWTKQVVVVADHPGERQLAAAAAMLLNTTDGTVLRGSADHRDDRGAPKLGGATAVVSPDASDEVRQAVGELASKR